MNDDGSVDVVDLQGYPLAPRLVKVLREQQGEKIQRFLESQCERWNSDIDAILSIHASTPDPAGQASFTAAPFMAPAPDPFVPKKPGLLGLIWRQYRERVERENETRQRAWNASVSEWQQDRKAHEEREDARRYDWEVGRASDVSSMERVLEERLASFDWPRETLITYQFQDDGKSVWLDVDLPEVEDMPTKQARVAARGLRLNIKDKSEAQVRKDYMRHVHGILFRLIGEAFYTLPAVDEVVASGYSQRADPGTGHVRDDYLLSVRVQRTDWVGVNFQNLEALDIVASLERFDLTRKMTKGGVFTPIEPFVPEEHPA